MLTISIDHSETADYIYQQIYQHKSGRFETQPDASYKGAV